jgi:hypothetical protein
VQFKSISLDYTVSDVRIAKEARGGEIEAPLASGSHLFPGILRLLVEGCRIHRLELTMFWLIVASRVRERLSG